MGVAAKKKHVGGTGPKEINLIQKKTIEKLKEKK